MQPLSAASLVAAAFSLSGGGSRGRCLAAGVLAAHRADRPVLLGDVAVGGLGIHRQQRGDLHLGLAVAHAGGVLHVGLAAVADATLGCRAPGHMPWSVLMPLRLGMRAWASAMFLSVRVKSAGTTRPG
jgi:hypothetical protein